MSRIGRKPLTIPKGVTISITVDTVSVKGPKGSLSMKKHKSVTIKQEGESLTFERANNDGASRAAHGLMRALCSNMVNGVTKGFERQLEINGVGYKAEVKGSNIALSLGFSHPIDFKLPEGITAKTDKNLLILSGIDRQALGAAAAKLRSYRPPEPYKGKGVKYLEEKIIRKAGKTAGK
jgi:large subunit ribosomal protein L6